MPKSQVSRRVVRPEAKLATLAFVMFAGAGVAAAQAPGSGERCPTRAADATAESRDAALRLGYEISLQAFDPRLAKTWVARGSRVGEAPGYTVRRLVTRCQPRSRSHNCYVEVTLCR